MENSKLEALSKLFWEYCKTFDDYEEFRYNRYTREEILNDIDSRIVVMK